MKSSLKKSYFVKWRGDGLVWQLDNNFLVHYNFIALFFLFYAHFCFFVLRLQEIILISNIIIYNIKRLAVFWLKTETK